MEVAFRETVIEAKERGQTVFLSSHILSEVEALCDRVGILRAGRLVDEGTLAELRHLSAQTVEVTFDGPAPSLDGAAGGERVRAAGANALRLEVSGSARAPDRGARRAPGARASRSREPSLEEIFLHHYDGQRRGSGSPRPGHERRERASRSLGGRSRDARTRTVALRAAVRARRLRPAGGLPQRLSDARGTASASSTRFAGNASAAPVLRQPLRPAERRRLQRLAGRRHPRDLRRRLGDARRRAGAARRGGQRAHRARARRAAVPARQAYVAAYAAIAGRARWSCGLALFAGLLAGGLPAGGVGLSRAGDRRVGARVRSASGALASQLAPSRRLALELGSALSLLVALRGARGRRHLLRRSAGCAG